MRALILALILAVACLPFAASTAAAATSAAMAPFHVALALAGHGVPEGARVVLRVHPAWAPLGAARFKELVESNYYDDQRFFRVLDGLYDIWIAQFGMHGDPATHAKWKSKPIRDDPVTQNNRRGTLCFAMSGPNTRTTQLFLNFGDGGKVLDSDFAPFAEVVQGMEAVDAIYKVGEGKPSGPGPSQGDIQAQGNAYLDKAYPKLTRVVTARVVEAPSDGGGAKEL